MTITTPHPLRALPGAAPGPAGRPGQQPDPRRSGSGLQVLPRPGTDPGRSIIRRRRLVVFGSMVMLVVGLFAVVVVHVVLAQQQFQLARVSAQVSAEQAANEQLSLQVAQLQAPSRIVSAAEQQMGMVSPPSVGYLVPGRPGSRVRAPAAPEPSTTTPPPSKP